MLKYLEPGLLDRRTLLVRAMFARLPQVEDRLDALRLQLGEVLEARLPAGAEVGVDPQEVPDRRHGGRRRGLRLGNEPDSGQEEEHGRSILTQESAEGAEETKESAHGDTGARRDTGESAHGGTAARRCTEELQAATRSTACSAGQTIRRPAVVRVESQAPSVGVSIEAVLVEVSASAAVEGMFVSAAGLGSRPHRCLLRVPPWPAEPHCRSTKGCFDDDHCDEAAGDILRAAVPRR